MPKSELFVGNLSKDVTNKDIEDAFDKYGKLVRCEIKNKGMGASFCFLEFEEERDAEVFIRIIFVYFFYLDRDITPKKISKLI